MDVVMASAFLGALDQHVRFALHGKRLSAAGIVSHETSRHGYTDWRSVIPDGERFGSLAQMMFHPVLPDTESALRAKHDVVTSSHR